MAQQVNTVQITVDIETAASIRKVAALRQEWDQQKKAIDLATKAMMNNAKTIGKMDELDEIKNKMKLATAEYNKLQAAVTGFKGNKNGDEFKKIHADYKLATKNLNELLKAQDKYDNVAFKDKGALIRENQATTASIKAMGLSMSGLNAEIDVEIRKNGFAALSTSELRREIKALNAELDKGGALLEDRQVKLDKVRLANAELGNRNKEKKLDVSFFDSVKSSMPAALVGGLAGAGVALAANAIEALGGVLSSVVPKMKELADANSDLKIALNLSDDEVGDLTSSLKKIDSRTPIKDLKELAMVAGDLNVAVGEVKDFVAEGDKVGIVFERSFGKGTQAVETIAKLSKEFKETKNQTYAESLAQIGSGLKVLEDDGPATAKSIAEFTARIGQMPDKMKPAIADVMALGAVFEEANLTAEISSGGLQNILLNTAQNANKVYEAMKAVQPEMAMTADEFKKLVNSNPNEAFLLMAQATQKLTATGLGNWLKDIGVNSQEATKVLAVTGDNLDKIRTKQDLASKSVIEASRLSEIYAEKNQNLAAQIDKAGKAISNFLEGLTIFKMGKDALIGFFGGIAEVLGNSKTSVDELNTKFKSQTSSVKNLTEHIEPLLDKYDKLKNNKAADAQAELKKVIGQIGLAIPGAISGFGQYGEALDINSGKARAFIAQQRAMIQIINKDRIDTVKDENVAARKERDVLQKKLQDILALDVNKDGNRVKKGEVFDQGGSAGFGGSKMSYGVVTDADIAKIQARLLTLKNIIGTTHSAWKGFRGEIDAPVKEVPVVKDRTKEVDYIKADGGKANKAFDKQVKEEASLLAEIAKLRAEALIDEYDRKMALREGEFLREIEEKKKEFTVKGKLTADYLKWEKLYRAEYHQESGVLAQEQFQKEIDEKTKLEKEAAERSHQLISDLLNEKLKTAEKIGNNPLDIFEAKTDVLKNQEMYEIENIKGKTEEVETAKKLIEDKYRELRTQAEDDFWRNQYEKDLAKKNESEAKKLKIEQKQDENRAKFKEQVRDQLFFYAGQAVQALGSIEKRKVAEQVKAETKAHEDGLKRLEEKKDKGLINEEDYQAQKLAMEEVFQKRQNEIKNKNAKIDKEMTIAKILLENTLNIVKATGMALVNPFALPLAIANGLAQLALALAVPIPEYAQGGMTDLGFNSAGTYFSKPTSTAQLAWVGEQGPEYIVPNNLLKKPMIANMVGFIEAARTNRIGGYAAGGLTSNIGDGGIDFGTGLVDNKKLMSVLEDSAKMIGELNKVLSGGIMAKTYIGNREVYEIDKLSANLERSRMLARNESI
jgi:hypothetical protein